METKANYTIVGFFTIAVIVAAFGFVYWMSQFGRGGEMVELVVSIPGSANGLSVGSPVRFNGIPVGSVRSLAINANDPRYSVAVTEVSADAPVLTSTKATLEVQGLTGAAYIELSGGNKGEPSILRKAIDEGTSAQIQADQSSVTSLLATADKIMDRANDAIGDIQGFVSDVRGPLTGTITNAERFSKSLADNSEGIDQFLESVSALSTSINSAAEKLDSTLTSADALVKSVNPQDVNRIVSNVARMTDELSTASVGVADTIATIRKTAETYERFGANATTTLAKVDSLLGAVDTQKVGNVINDASVASADARRAISTFASLADSVRERQPEIDQTITDVTQIANKLNAASSRVDGILVKLDGFLGDADAPGISQDARQTLASFRSVADNINAQIGPIANNLKRFTSSGLRDIEALVDDTRRTVQSLDSTISTFDKNPQRLLFGGETVKQYDGRTRR
ncbi:phospholipid/cholesterol/gamma-HCH transport system substrate-binding protein [Rhizobium sp. PP-F2F-G38]|uniref:MCE family protein n=1 Tax=Ferranicluibacter rubi TaxID=2715133 RepID=A0AA44CBM5_9HYPH|nr:MlaD family protein [Ferranicluibacter rubi]PYE37133.1 phospholipid/cholesterol/gamma-HCH transport system substrate-binding protein [Rhizobium sp. PP-WC-1G-195]PYF00585.1 phospholipid/cholesterol/gamma-HCH transport system substrate-binding protein [Rhizobium sp. PP-F2F-G38]TCQ09824.1 phospholipid/cholesterol/gamma-HCH transport system substrate-binding protein [Rhizobium sp. PP-F2F-G36]TCQ28090.1 phospholipid/cholesterol/gamma-HCH transport system substrate-binding protein [Rhizobium sp. P